ncbi:MAG: hypothetical protein WC869_02090 [Phycisphaerae bacterium]|jgi:hypothetical protein
MANSGVFSREVNPSLIADLRESAMFNEHLWGDITNIDWKDRVFPAIRKKRIDFYYSGGKLFSYDQNARFTTHRKYASVFDVTNNYVSEQDLLTARPIANFCEAYGRIKANCAMYAGVETQGLSNAHKRSSFAACDDDVVVLDIEVALAGMDDGQDRATELQPGGNSNRLDLLLYDKVNRSLRFYEGKHYSNPELWAEPGRRPKVVAQLHRYNEMLRRKDKQQQILVAYTSYVATMNSLFDLALPPPRTVEETVVLLVFGYDDRQAPRIDELLLSDDSLKGFRFRQKGDTRNSKFSANVLWQKVRQY